MNMAILLGRIGKDLELKQAGGTSVVNFTLATDERWTDKQGQAQQKTEWHKVAVFGKQAETCAEYLHKGSSVLVRGSVQTREWIGKDNQKNYTTEIRAEHVEFLGQGGGKKKDHDEPADPPPFF